MGEAGRRGGIKVPFFAFSAERIWGGEAQRKVFFRLCASGEAEGKNGKLFHDDSWEEQGRGVLARWFQTRIILELMFWFVKRCSPSRTRRS